MDIRVYECIDCSNLPNIGKLVCFFEAGINYGIFKELTRKDMMARNRCWTNGYSFCQFEVLQLKIEKSNLIIKFYLKFH